MLGKRKSLYVLASTLWTCHHVYMCVRLSVYVRVCVRVQFNCMFVYFCVFVFTSIVRRRHFFKLPSARTIFMLIRRISVNYFTVKNSIWLSLHSVWFVYPTDLSSFSLKSLLLLMKPNNSSMTVIRFYCCWCWNLWNSMNYFRTWNFPILEIACRIGIQIIHLIKKKLIGMRSQNWNGRCGF